MRLHHLQLFQTLFYVAERLFFFIYFLGLPVFYVHWVDLADIPCIEEIIFDGVCVVGKALNMVRADVPFLLVVSRSRPSYLIYVVVWWQVQLVAADHGLAFSINQMTFFLNVAEFLFWVKWLAILYERVKFW